MQFLVIIAAIFALDWFARQENQAAYRAKKEQEFLDLFKDHLS